VNIGGVRGFGGITPLLAVALLAGGAAAYIATADPGIQRGALPSLAIHGGDAGVASSAVLAAAFTTSSSSPLSIAASSPSSVLRQTGSQERETTVLVYDANPACSDVPPVSPSTAGAGPRDVWYLGGGPGPEILGQTVAVEGEQPQSPTTGTTQSLTTGSSCEVTVAFAGLRQVPKTATLVLDQAGASSAVPLTVSRDVTLFYYLGIPAIVGGVMTLLLLMLSLRIPLYDWDEEPLPRYSRKWRECPILGSGAWALNDSWLTNVSTGLVVVGTVLAETSAANSLFPGLALDRFAIVNIVAVAIVAAAPVVFGILYARFTAANPGLIADATVKVPVDKFVRIVVPSGASITTSGDATVRGNAGNQATVRSGCTYQIPAGSVIEVRAGVQAEALQAVPVMAFAGAADIGVRPGCTLAIKAPVGTWTVQGSDQLVLPWPKPAPADVHIKYPAHIDVPDGAKITVTGTADVTFPPDTVIEAPRRGTYTLTKERRLLAPQGTNVLVGNMGMIIAANFITMFGIGAELGIAGVLAYFSEATQLCRVGMFCGIAAVAILVFVYAKTATRTMADPQPGSSLSAQAGTSFTL
jgi:hypothetical protein